MLGIEEETKYGSSGEAIANGVVVGDNIVMPCESSNGEQFWLMLCDKPIHVVTNTFTNIYKNTYHEGDWVIHG
jgi:hypothetical protein